MRSQVSGDSFDSVCRKMKSLGFNVVPLESGFEMLKQMPVQTTNRARVQS